MHLPATTWIVSTVVFTHSAGRMVSTFLAVYLFSELDASSTWISIVFASYGLGTVSGSLMSGWLCTRFSLKSIATISLFLTGAGFLYLSTLKDPLYFAIFISFCGIFEGMFRPPIIALLMEAVGPDDRTRSYAIYQTFVNVGYAIGAAFGGLLASFKFSLIFVADGVSSLLAALIIIIFSSYKYWKTDSTPEQRKTHNPKSKHGIIFYFICAFAMVNYCVINQRLSIYPLYLTTNYGLAPTQLGALFMMNSLMIAAVGVFITDMIKKCDQRQIAALGSLLICGSFAILPAGDSFEFALFAYILTTIGEILFMPAVVVLAYGSARRDSSRKSLGFFFAINSACRAFGPLLGIWAFDLIGPTNTWLICGTAGLAALALLLIPIHSNRETSP